MFYCLLFFIFSFSSLFAINNTQYKKYNFDENNFKKNCKIYFKDAATCDGKIKSIIHHIHNNHKFLILGKNSLSENQKNIDQELSTYFKKNNIDLTMLNPELLIETFELFCIYCDTYNINTSSSVKNCLNEFLSELLAQINNSMHQKNQLRCNSIGQKIITIHLSKIDKLIKKIKTPEEIQLFLKTIVTYIDKINALLDTQYTLVFHCEAGIHITEKVLSTMNDSFEETFEKYFIDRASCKRNNNILKQNIAVNSKFFCIKYGDLLEKYEKNAYKDLTEYFKKKGIDLTILHPKLERSAVTYTYFHQHNKQNIIVTNFLNEFFRITFSQITIIAQKPNNQIEKIHINIHLDTVEELLQKISRQDIETCLTELIVYGNHIIKGQTNLMNFTFQCKQDAQYLTPAFLNTMNNEIFIWNYGNQIIDLQKSPFNHYITITNDKILQKQHYNKIKDELNAITKMGNICFPIDDYCEEDEKEVENICAFFKQHNIPLIPLDRRTLRKLLEYPVADLQDELRFRIIQPLSNLQWQKMDNKLIIFNIAALNKLSDENNNSKKPSFIRLSFILHHVKKFIESMFTQQQYTVVFVNENNNNNNNTSIGDQFIELINTLNNIPQPTPKPTLMLIKKPKFSHSKSIPDPIIPDPIPTSLTESTLRNEKYTIKNSSHTPTFEPIVMPIITTNTSDSTSQSNNKNQIENKEEKPILKKNYRAHLQEIIHKIIHYLYMLKQKGKKLTLMIFSSLMKQ